MLSRNYLKKDGRGDAVLRLSIRFCVGLLILFQSPSIVLAETDRIYLSVSENTTVGTEVARLNGTSEGGYLLVSDDDAPFRSYFNVDLLESSGVIVTKLELNHEQNTIFYASIFNLSDSDVIQVEISVLDVNDNAPKFVETVINLNISEATQTGSKFSLGSATDADSDPFNVQGYRIAGGNAKQSFAVNNRTVGKQVFADLIVNSNLNREEIPSFELVVEAYDGGQPPKSGTALVQVHILDVNDNPPTFDLSRYTVAIPEDLAPGQDVITLTATDKDLGINSEIFYRIDRTKSDPDSYFMVDANNGRIYLNRKLDYEHAVQHKIVLDAVDRGSEPLVGSTVVIVDVQDINDNKPNINIIFLDGNEAKVSEAAEPGDYIARVSVNDPDLGEISQVNLTLTGGDGRFGLQTENSIIYLVCVKNPLDRETQATYHITLNATDFDSPEQSAHISFTLTVEDVNDNPPRFDQDLYEFDLSEQVFPGTYVTQVKAVDPDEGINAEVTYRLETSAQSNWFDINEDSGLITTAQYLDHDVNPQVRLLVIAADKGSPSMKSNTSLLIRISDATDSAPVFDHSSVSKTVSENSANGTCVLQVHASDPDSSNSDSTSSVTYSFAIESAPSPFTLNAITGQLCIGSSLDRETEDSYVLDIQATDQGGQWDRMRVFITVADFNDHAPVFHPVEYRVNVDRSIAEVGFPITQVSATDQDDPLGSGFGRITYNIMSGNDDALFQLNALTGKVAVAKLLNDVEAGNTYQLEVGAVDGGGLGAVENATVVITVVDNSATGGPTFGEPHYQFNVTEEEADFAAIGTVSASFSDGHPTYSIRHDPPHTSWFSINPITGVISVTDRIDREVLSSVEFQVLAAAGNPPIYGFATVRVTIEDVNDNSPRFRQEDFIKPLIVPYNTPVGAGIVRITASDPDAGANGTVRYRTTSDQFSVDEITGQIKLHQELPQRTLNYSLDLETYDLGQPSSSTSSELVISVQPPDQNCPLFATADYTEHIAEDQPLSTIFANVKATATNPSASVAHYIETSSDSHPFAIFSNGSLYLRRRVDREVQSSHVIKVVAAGHPSTQQILPTFCTSSAEVTITINDVNDNPPIFDSTSYKFHLQENLGKDALVGSVRATDRDSGKNARLSYALPVPNTAFSIDSETGAIYAIAGLDYESNRRFSFLVDSSDGKHLAQTTVLVVVDDVNDNTPHFVSASDGQDHLAVVSKAATAGTWVADMRAVDLDSAENGKLSYLIVEPNNDLFAIDRDSGSVTVQSELSQNNIGTYSVLIKTEDGGSPSRSATANLQIRVSGLNANPAQFDGNKFVFAPREDATPGVVLGSFLSDSASRRRRSMATSTYRIIDGDQNDNFYLNATTAELSLLRKLDYESTAQFSLKVEKTSPDDLVNTLTGQVNIRDSNDHTPTFTTSRLLFSVDENTPMGTEVRRFLAEDLDEGLNGEVVYSLVSESPTHAFVIDSESGALTVDAELDREKISQYFVVVNASDRASTETKFSTATAVILLRDINDNFPTFVNRDKIYVMEDETVGYPVVWLSADDPDLGANGRVVFDLVSASSDSVKTMSESEEMAYFHIDPVTGIVTLTKELDYERATTHVLNISATDRSTHNQRTTHQNLILHVIDVNDIAPHFERPIYVAQVPEETDAGFVVTKVTALDEDSGDNGHLTYQLQRSSDSDAFDIDPSTGVITASQTLDRETKDMFKLTVFAQDEAFPSLYDWCEVEVIVTDVNDNAPSFEPLDGSTDPPILARLEISEAADASLVIHTVAAFDVDAGNNSMIDYSIVDGNIAHDFTINATSGELRTTRRLDRETTSSYRLKVAAVDRGSPVAKSSAGIVEVTVLDWNDNNPQFVENSYTGNVTEGLTKGQYVLTVRATDADEGLNGVLSYYLNESATEQLSGLFTINTITGVITTASSLDAEQTRRHSFIVTAIDSAPYGPRKTQVAVTVDVLDVNDNSPAFENSLVKAGVSRSASVGMLVAHVTATDDDVGANGELVYSFSNTSNTENAFHIDPGNGDITITSSFPSILNQRYSLEIIASDRGNPPRQTQAIVDINIVGVTGGNTIQFENSSYVATMSERVQKNFKVTTVKALWNRKPDSDIVYDFPSGNENGAFGMTDGSIRVVQPRLLDYEKAPSIRLIVSATKPGSGLNGYATVNIQLQDENDNSPIFAQDKYVMQVFEEKIKHTYVTAVKAFDKDSGVNGEVRYFIISGNKDNAFAIDSVSGMLTTNLKLDREIHDKYRLILHAIDLSDSVRNTGTGTIEITVMDIDDHSPTLDVPEYVSISEGTAVGSELTTVTANDLDLDPHVQLRFASNGNPGNFFSIDRHSGKITLITPLDYETTPNVTLRIVAYDTFHEVQENLLVRVTDVNDNAPKFDRQSYHTLLDELSPINTSVIQVQAEDADSGDNGRVSYRLDTILPNNPLFVIDPDTGWITVNKSEPLRPQSYLFNLEVEAYDHGEPPRSQSISVRVQIRDVNDNAPIFSQKLYEKTISEGVPRGHSVINVTATDADYSLENRNVFYRIVSGNVGGVFDVRTISGPAKQTIGEVYVRSELDRENVSAYSLTISAYDQGEPQQSSNATIDVHILDVNDNRPRFKKSRYYGSVKENVDGIREQKPVLSVYATDPDSTSDFRFKIISGNDDGAFEIADCDPPSRGCAQLLAKFVDYEATPRYELTVQVYDARNSIIARSSTVAVTVDIEDVNEYSPRFARYFLQKDIVESAAANATLFNAVATDEDGGEFGEITYSLARSNWQTVGEKCKPSYEVFRIVPNTGEVYATRTLDYEECQQYNFQVLARDASGRKEAMMPVAVRVLPIDEHPPHFVAEYVEGVPRYHFTVPYGSPSGYQVGRVNATDADSGEDGQVRYRLEEDSSDGYVINELSGVISLTREIDSGNSRILIVTAESTSQKATTHITVVISGAPSIAVEAQILSIVFGVIAGAACLVVLFLCTKHCWNKRQLRREAAEEKKPGQNGRMRPDGSPARSLFREGDSHQQVAPKIFVNSSGDYQSRKYNATMTSASSNGMTANGRKNKQFNANNNAFDGYAANMAGSGSSIDKRIPRHRMMKPHEPTHTGNDGSAEDEEVNRITSTTSSSGRQSSSTSLLSDKKPRVADSGIQQDIDRLSFDAGGNPQASVTQSESIESIHEFDSDRVGVGHVDVTLPSYSNHVTEANGAGEEMAPAIDSLGPDLQEHVGNLPVTLNALAEGPSLNAREGPQEQLQDWTPEFQPLTSVFSEIARLREESAAIREATAQKQQQHARAGTSATGSRGSNAASVLSDHPNRPPPLLTSVPQHSGSIAAPVPIASGSGARPNFDLGHVPLKGLLPRPNPHYHGQAANTHPLRNHPSGVPPPYSYVMSTRPSSGKSRGSAASKTPVGGATTGPSSLDSLPRTPNSHESSFTSPAMSPSLSPSLSPLAEHSPLAESHSSIASSGKVKRSRSDETTLSSNSQERMVHV